MAAAVAAILAELMYRFSPAVAVAAFAAPAVLGLVAWRPVLGIYGALLSIPLEAFGTSVGSANVTPAKGLLILTAVSILPRLALDSSDRRLHVVHVWFLALIVISLSGLFFAPDTHAVLVITGNAFAYLIISIYVARMQSHELRSLLVVLVVSGGIVGAVAILTAGSSSGPSASSDAARAQLGFDSPNVLAFYLLLTLGPALAVLAHPSFGWRRLLALAATPPIVVGLVLTQSRTGLIGGILTIFVLLGSSRFRKVAAGLAVVLLSVVIFNFGDVMRSPQLTAVQQRLASISSLSGVAHDPRVQIWRTTPTIITDHPLLGVGEGNFPAISAGYGLLAFDLTPIDHAHDIFLTVAAELGLIGLAVFLVFLSAFMRAAWRGLAWTSDRTLVLGVAASFTGLLFASIGDYPPRNPAILATMLIMVGVMLAFEKLAGADGADGGARGQRWSANQRLTAS